METNNIIKSVSIILSVAVISSTSSALVSGKAKILLTTNKEEAIQSSKNINVNNDELNKCDHATNDYTFKAFKNTPNEIEFIQTKSDLAIYKVQDAALSTIYNPTASQNSSRLVFKRQDDNNIIVDIDRITTDGDLKNRLYYQVHATFEKGNWADLANNKPVVIKISNQEEESSKSYIREWMQRKVVGIAKALKPNVIFYEPQNPIFDFHAPIIEGNLNEMVHKIEKTKLKVDLPWKYNLFG